MSFDWKTATPLTSGLSDAKFFFGTESQSAATPSIYQNSALRAYLLALVDETYGVSIYNSTAIGLGTYYADRYASVPSTQTSLYAEIISGTAGSSVQFYLTIGGVNVSTQTVTQGTALNVTLSTSIAVGQTVSFILFSIAGTVNEIFLKTGGHPV